MSETPDGARDEAADAPPLPPPPSAPAWPAPDADSTATTWVSPAPTPAPGADATPTQATPVPPTSVDPLVPPAGAPVPPPAPPVAPGWGAAPPPPAWTTAPPPAAYPPPVAGPVPPAYGQPPQYAGAALPGVAGWGAVPQAPKPGVVPLRPLGVGEILDGAISYIRRDPKTVLGISAVIAVVLALVQFATLAATAQSLAVTTSSTADIDQVIGSLGSVTATLLQTVIGLVVGVLATGLLTVVMGQAVLGRRVTAGEAWARTRTRFWPLLGLTLLVSLVTFGVVVLGILLAIAVGALLGNVGGAGLGVLVGVFLGLGVLAAALWLYIKLLLAPVALILESAPVVRSMSRSWKLVEGAWWRTFGIYLLGSILAAVVSSVLTIPFTIVGAFLSFSAMENGDVLPLSYTIAVSLATLVSSIVVIPFSAGIVSLLYIDRRIRREALDIELARAAGVGA
jgi:hypothetical protein